MVERQGQIEKGVKVAFHASGWGELMTNFGTAHPDGFLGLGVPCNFVHEKDFLKSLLELNEHCDLPEKLEEVLFLRKRTS